MTGLAKNPLAGLAALGLAGAIPANTGGLNPTGELKLLFFCTNMFYMNLWYSLLMGPCNLF